jgi:hypothetical protein
LVTNNWIWKSTRSQQHTIAKVAKKSAKQKLKLATMCNVVKKEKQQTFNALNQSFGQNTLNLNI